MRALALAVVQLDDFADPSAALATAPGASRYLLRAADAAAACQVPGVRVIRTAGFMDRAAAAAYLRDEAHADVTVVLLASEAASAELAAALAALDVGEDAAFVVPRVHRFLGREVTGAPAVIAWRGDPRRAAARVALPGRLVAEEPDITTAIARLDRAAALGAAARAGVGVRDFVTQPIASLARRAWMRRRDGVPGAVLSVLETYGEIVIAAKVWEREERAGRTRVTPSSRRVPPGFTALATRSGFVVVREDMREPLLDALLEATPESVVGEMLNRGGRGATWSITLGDGGRAVLRWYRRGGLLRHLVRDRYFGRRRLRPLLELAATDEARRRGVAVPEVLGARVDLLRGGGYRGAIVTREIGGAETLGDAVRREPAGSERAAIIGGVARTVRMMHDRGMHHRDLNVGNILLSHDGDRLAVHVIDLDRARLGGSVAPRLRRRALRRLARSLAKLERPGDPRAADDRAAFHRAYRERA